jgi:hypothetical protein
MRPDLPTSVMTVARDALLGGATGLEREGVGVGPRVRVFGAVHEDRRLACWAVGRFEGAGLEESCREAQSHRGS